MSCMNLSSESSVTERAASKRANAVCWHYIRPCVCSRGPGLLCVYKKNRDYRTGSILYFYFFILLNECLIPHCPLSSCHVLNSCMSGLTRVKRSTGQLPSAGESTPAECSVRAESPVWPSRTNRNSSCRLQLFVFLNECGDEQLWSPGVSPSVSLLRKYPKVEAKSGESSTLWT